MRWLLLATLLVGTLLPALNARDEVPQAEPCAMFQSDASNMRLEGREALKKILMPCFRDIVGSECREAIELFQIEYGERFKAINRGVQAWSLLEQRANIRKQLEPNYNDDPKLIGLRECLENAGATGAPSERDEDALFDGRRGKSQSGTETVSIITTIRKAEQSHSRSIFVASSTRNKRNSQWQLTQNSLTAPSNIAARPLLIAPTEMD